MYPNSPINDQMPPGLRYGPSSIGLLMAKTYSLLAVTLIISAGAAFYGMHSTIPAEHPFLLMIGAFALLFAVQFTGKRQSPLAVPLVFAFAAAMGLFMGPAIAQYLKLPDGPAIVTEALGATALMFIGLSAYAMVSRHDFSHFYGFLFTGLILAIVGTIVNLLFLHLPALQLAIAGVLVLVFSGLILFDTQRMIEGGIQEPALLVVSLYLDIINLFMALLQIFGGGSSE